MRQKKHQYFSIVSLPTDSVIVDHAVEPSSFCKKFGKIIFWFILMDFNKQKTKYGIPIICFKIKHPPPVELCWQKQRNY
jgi:hypothetical protein